jgi:hypothetical protein
MDETTDQLRIPGQLFGRVTGQPPDAGRDFLDVRFWMETDAAENDRAGPEHTNPSVFGTLRTDGSPGALVRVFAAVVINHPFGHPYVAVSRGTVETYYRIPDVRGWVLKVFRTD